LQLKQDGRLKTKSFRELIKPAIGQLPLLGKPARTNPDEPTGNEQASPSPKDQARRLPGN
jgi:hypothetical protein